MLRSCAASVALAISTSLRADAEVAVAALGYLAEDRAIAGRDLFWHQTFAAVSSDTSARPLALMTRADGVIE
jgi:hypothetical protein